MALHPQIAAFAAQLDDLSRLLRGHGDRWWSGKLDLIQRAVADSNFTGVERFLGLFEGEESFADFTLRDAAGQVVPANVELEQCRAAARAMAERLAREEGANGG